MEAKEDKMLHKQHEPGDKVKLSTVKEEIEGILLESQEQGVYLIKLKSGYNIGIKKEDVHRLEIVGKKKEEKIASFKHSLNKNLKNIDLIVSGGTISSKVDYETGGVKSLTQPEELLQFYPELKEIVNVRKIISPFSKFSEDMDSLDWKEIAKIAVQSLNDEECEGVIITHGTDTLHYTSSALSFFLRDLNKPVVLTYSQRSSDRASSDAQLNLIAAAKMAVSEAAEVMIVGHASSSDDFCYAFRGTKVRKMHTSKRDAFKSINERPIAKIGEKIEFMNSFSPRDNSKKVKLDDKFNDKIALIKFYPGMDAEIIDYYSRYQGIIIEVAVLGHVAGDEARKNLIPVLRKAIDNGLVICAVPQTIYGRLNPLVYSAGRMLMKTGVIFLEDMLPETAFVKLGWVLGHKDWKVKIKEKMLENFSGEINSRIEK